MNTWHKIRWMIWYEGLIHWRRRNLALIGGGFLFALIALTLFMGNEYQEIEIPRTGVLPDGFISGQATRIEEVGDEVVVTQVRGERMTELGRYTPEGYEATIRTTWLANIIISTLLILLVIIPPMMSDNIAYDRHTGTRELLNALPLTKATYLGGKVAATWTAITVIVLVGAFIHAPFAYAVIGAYQLHVYIMIILITALPMSLFIAALSILIPADTATRRSATLIGLSIIFLSPVLFIPLFIAVTLIQSFWIPFPFINYPSVLQPTLVPQTISLFATMLITLIVCWTAMWSWMRYKATR
jgi:hypothetical protein